MMEGKKKPHSRVNISSRSHRKLQTMKDKNKQKTENKKPCGMNKSASLTLVQGPSTVVCMIVT
jgi:hypothetical protein